jgi:hypothetical protein
VVSAGYVGNWGYNQNLTSNINPIPIGTRFQPSSADATNGGKPLPDIFLRTVYPGLNTINLHNFVGHTNYNALQATVQRRFSRGLSWGLAYTWSKDLGTTSFTPVVPNNEAWNYGLLAADRRHNLQVNYTYDFPNAGAALHSKLLGALVDHWSMAGIFSVQSGAPFNPGAPNVNGSSVDYTGTPDVSARVLVMGDPMANVPAGSFFNPSAFGVPAPGSSIKAPVLGNLGGGAGVMSYPHVTNLDATMTKLIPIRGERIRAKLQVQAYNLLNHPQFNSVNTAITWDASGNVNNAATAGVFNGTLPARILAFQARLEF